MLIASVRPVLIINCKDDGYASAPLCVILMLLIEFTALKACVIVFVVSVKACPCISVFFLVLNSRDSMHVLLLWLSFVLLYKAYTHTRNKDGVIDRLAPFAYRTLQLCFFLTKDVIVDA
jgi:hypothetical protein